MLSNTTRHITLFISKRLCTHIRHHDLASKVLSNGCKSNRHYCTAPRFLIAGIDEAGRGPLIGPMVVAGIVLDERQENKFKEIGVKDSKAISPKKRAMLYDWIIDNAVTIVSLPIQAHEIDSKRRSGISLNQIELEIMLEVIRQIRQKLQTQQLTTLKSLYIDSVDIKPSRFGAHFENMLSIDPSPLKTNVICQHGADSTYTVVSAASIIAKVERDRAIKELEQVHNVTLGSGYPSDPLTLKYVSQFYDKSLQPRSDLQIPNFIRQTWKLSPTNKKNIL